MSTTFTTKATRRRAAQLVKEAVEATSNAEVAARLKVGRPTCWRWSQIGTDDGRLPHALFAKRILRVLGKVIP